MPQALTLSVWPEIPAGAIVLVPLGSTEQHGPHLPFSTDTAIATAVAEAVAQVVEQATSQPVVVAPPMPYGASGEHQAFPGTISIGHDALRVVLIELIRSLSTWAGHVIFVNGHGGNLPTVTSVIEQMQGEQHRVSSVSCALESATDAHAGHDETSVLLHLMPEHVRTDALSPGNTQPLGEILTDLMAHGVRPVSESGVLGDPTTASPEVGKDAFIELVERVARHVVQEVSHER
jgi:mycofactocin system creatininase family protein